MNTQTAATSLLELLKVPALSFLPPSPSHSQRNPEAKGVPHAIWMLEGIADGYVQYDKAHRWLGYAQALLVCDGILTVDQAKGINKAS